MKLNVTVAVGLVSLATATPAIIEKRQSANDLTRGSCKGVVLIFARGTTEPGNIGTFVGTPLVAQLKKGLSGDLAVEGVNYAAGIATNLGAGGADPKGVSEGARLFALAATKCPQAVLIGGGYSQGAAVMHGAAKGLEKSVQDKIAGIALFGDTQNKQSGGHIKGLPAEKSKVFCIEGDGVCNGALAVNVAHMSYPGSPMLKAGADWLLERIKVTKAGMSGSAPPAEGAPAEGAPAEAGSSGMAGMAGMGMGNMPSKGPKSMGGAKGAKGMGGMKGMGGPE